ncbi:MAG: glycosyltransferase family 4 protein, partial [Porticoccaceae bacterium]|nr:glycosyltransferase family 4 protein [Porticoccaceae bacterium]
LTKSTLGRTDETNYKRPKGSINKCKGLINLYLFLRLAKKYKILIAWTFHNTKSHEGDDFMDMIGYTIMSKMTNLVIFHSHISKIEFSKLYHSENTKLIMPHGNYKGAYPTPRDRDLIISELGLKKDLPIVSCLGMLRDYKGLDTACEAIKLLDGQCQLLIAGSPHDTFDLNKLTSAMKILPNSILIPKFISDQNFSDYCAASDLILLPYKKISGSGALLAALSFSRGIVASDLPYFREIIGGTPNAGRLFKQGDPIALADAITSFLEVDELTRNSSAKTLCTNYDWDNVITDVAKAYKDWGNKNAR